MAMNQSMYSKNKKTFDLVDNISLNVLYSTPDGEEYELQEMLESSYAWGDEPYQEENVAMEISFLLEELKPKVSERAYEVILKKLEGYTNDELSADMGISRQAVGQLLHKYKEEIYRVLVN